MKSVIELLPPSQSSSLEFVTVSNPGDILTTSNQKRIRRHARKSVPRTARSRRKLISRTFEITLIRSPTQDTTLPIINVPENVDLISFPVEATPRIRELVAFACHRATYVYNPTFKAWFNIALSDAAAFYMTLSYAALGLAQLRKGKPNDQLDEDDEALELYNLSLQNVQSRLENPSDDNTFGGILGFACRDITTGDFIRSTTHLCGLKRFLDTHGILLTQTPTDFRIMLTDIDVSSSFAQDIAPLFPAPLDLCEEIFHRYLSTFSPAFKATLQLWSKAFPNDAEVISAFRWVAALANFVQENSSSPQFWFGDKIACMTFVVLHRVLSLKRHDLTMDTTPELQAREALRLALIIFLDNIKRSIGHTHGGSAASYHSKVDKLRDQLNAHMLPELQLWTLVVSGIRQSQSIHAQELYARKISEVMSRIGLRDWSSAMHVVRNLVWIDNLEFSDRTKSLGVAVEAELN